ncbi:MAG: 16S rRNA (guanine(966)-N(2))-methyltransferase RsmD [Spirochaetales bacterium]|nr:16S rRNA (guanine(966)-N(2))-methyltransferase RsmD [Spirochaetales bacterium]
MRITGGIYRGRHIQCPKGVIRPAMDRMRESLFSILGPLDGSSFLDLFSGSGIIGIEAASRGAEPVVLVEMDHIKKPVLKKNVAFVETAITPYFMPAQAFLRSCKDTFDYIFLDPPFPLHGKTGFIDLIMKKRVLKPHGTLLIHYPKEDALADTIGGFHCTDTRHYGRSTVKFYRYTEAEESLQ